MLVVLRVHLPSDVPIVGYEITPYVLVRLPDGRITANDVPESSPAGGFFLRHKWYRVQSDSKVALCSMHPNEQAKLQCIACIKAGIPVAVSYHCSPTCFSNAWNHHRALHEQASNTTNESVSGNKPVGRLSNRGLGGPSPSSTHGSAERNVLETLHEVGITKTFIPKIDDIGHALKFEVVVVRAGMMIPAGGRSVSTSRVIPSLFPHPRRLVPVIGEDVLSRLDLDGRNVPVGKFSVLSYNILSDLYCKSELYSYCPSWALSWAYRRQNLLREIVGYHADIVCLQEVQSEHFQDFLAPELDKHGYYAMYKKNTSEARNGNVSSVDGCATFFRRDRFSHVKNYELEYNKAAQPLIEAVTPVSRKEIAQSRLIKDNIALVTVLEAAFDKHGADPCGNRQLICVANTHVNVDEDAKDVGLFQVHTLVKGLEKLASSVDIPMLVCGDFSSLPGSAPHSLLARGKVDEMHPDLAVDPFGIFRPVTKLTHRVSLVSAYSSFSSLKGARTSSHQRRMGPLDTKEPLFTRFTRDFIGTTDYIFYTDKSLTVESLLELLDEVNLRRFTALPSPEWSSDHLALLAEFRCTARASR